MLRRAIEANWSKPDEIVTEEKKQQRFQKNQIEATQAEIEDDRVSEAKQEKKSRREQLLPVRDNLSNEEQSQIEKQAFEELNSDFLRERFKKNEEF